MPTHRPLLQLAVMITLLVTLTTVSARTYKAQAQRGDDIQPAAAGAEQAGYGKTTGLVGIVQGQTARLTVWNKGDEAVLTRLQFVDEQSKVLIQCDATIQLGKAGTIEFPGFTGGVTRTELQAQFGTIEKRSIGLLVPTFQVIDNATGANSWMIGPEGFVDFSFVPGGNW